MSADLTAMAESVTTQADFLRFAHALVADWEEEQSLVANNSVPNEQRRAKWEHSTVEGFLSAMIQWIEDSDHARRYDAAPEWRLFAFILLAGSRYE